MSDKNILIELLNKENNKLNKKLTELDPNEEILALYLKQTLAMELLYLVEEDELKRFVDDDTTYDDVIKNYMYWDGNNDSLEEEIVFKVRENFFDKLSARNDYWSN